MCHPTRFALGSRKRPDPFMAKWFRIGLPREPALFSLSDSPSTKASFLDEVRAKAASLGMSLADLVGFGRKKTAGTPKAAESATAKYQIQKQAKPGRAEVARWLTELEAKGRKRQEFAV